MDDAWLTGLAAASKAMVDEAAAAAAEAEKEERESKSWVDGSLTFLLITFLKLL